MPPSPRRQPSVHPYRLVIASKGVAVAWQSPGRGTSATYPRQLTATHRLCTVHDCHFERSREIPRSRNENTRTRLFPKYLPAPAHRHTPAHCHTPARLPAPAHRHAPAHRRISVSPISFIYSSKRYFRIGIGGAQSKKRTSAGETEFHFLRNSNRTRCPDFIRFFAFAW